MNKLKMLVQDADKVLIAGHKRPDGDCTGACIAAYHFLKKEFPEKQITVFLENMPEVYAFLDEHREIVTNQLPDQTYDLFIALDSSTADCLG
ncbi:MAG: DHH family phosphoesterase, partial [Clostridiaceae bacterium]|nr:DHH family phosphoesterase [Clostridiaceae bacterium]